MITTAYIFISPAKFELIKVKWGRNAQIPDNSEVLDWTIPMTFRLRIPVQFRNGQTHMLLPSRLETESVNGILKLKILSDLTKPIIAAVFMSILYSALIIVLHRNLLVFIISIPTFGAIHYYFLKRKIAKIAIEYLETLIGDYLK